MALNVSNNITSIINELNQDTKRANESIENAVNGVKKQNELIEETRERFIQVAAASNEGLENSKVTVEEIEKCKKIFESIYELARDLQIY